MYAVRLTFVLLAFLGAARPAALVRVPGPPAPPLGAIEPNQGQASPEILFLKRGLDSVAVTGEAVIFGTFGVRQRFVGAASGATTQFLDPMPGVIHAYSGGDPARWRTGIARYAAALIESVYPGVDVRYEIDAQGRLIQRLLLDPGVGPETVVLEVPSAKGLAILPDGTLQVRLGEQVRPPMPDLTLPAPSAVQRTATGSFQRIARFRALSSTQYTVAVEGHDDAFPLEIALTLSGAATTYWNGSEASHAVDEDGATFAVTTIPDAAGKPAPFPQMDWAGCGVNFYIPIPCTDVAVYKVAAGGELAYVTYLEGRTNEYAPFLDLAADGAVVIAGTVDSSDFPTTAGALQAAYGGPSAPGQSLGPVDYIRGDLFAARLDPRTGELLASTFLGGPNADQMGTAALGLDGSLYFLHKWLGQRSSQMPASPTALAPECPEPCEQGYAARLSPALDRLLYGTYLPGNIQATAALHSDGSVYYAGSAEAGFPASPSAYKRDPDGQSDGFVARLDPQGEQLLFATMVGGPDTDWILRMAVAPDGSVWASVSSFVDCCVDIDYRLVRFDAKGERLLTDLPIDIGDIVVAADGNLRAIASGQFAVSPDAFLAHPCGFPDLAYIELTPAGEQLFGTYLPAGTYYDFAQVGASGRTAITADGGRFEIVEDQAPGMFAGCIVDAASFSYGAPAPGQIVTLFGSGLGPVAGAAFELENGRVPTSVGGVRVLIDGTPAPILFASYWQINAIAPDRLSVGASTEIVVEYDGRTTEPLPSVYVAQAAIDLFRWNDSPDQPAAALNQDGTVNSTANPAAPGSAVVLFGTGGGATVPPSEAGEVTPLELRVLDQTPTVRVYAEGGLELRVEFAGAAPGLVAGVTQINVRLPEEIPEVPGFAPGLLPLRVETPGSTYPSDWVTVAVDVN